jgi:penicillin G amidase
MRSVRPVGIVGALAVSAALALVLGAPVSAQAQNASDQLTAMNVVPPGESGDTTLAQFSAVTAGTSSSYGPHTDDQEPLYANWQYKPMQFEGEGDGTAPPGDPNVKIWRDPTYGVPTITGTTDADLFYGVGYAMAQDRLFQMEVFRHVGHGTLASLIGASGLPMDEQVRRFTEGDTALMKEFDRLPTDAQVRTEEFVDGINAYIQQLNPLTMPAEFSLLGDLPVKPWTVLDVLAFGEYAGRFFGEFGHGELGDLQTYDDLVQRYGTRKALQIFNDLVPLNDPHAPTSISRADGIFPRHLGRAVKNTNKHFALANDNPSAEPTAAEVAPIAATVDRLQNEVHTLQRELALPRFGSNAIIVSGKLTKDHKAMLYGGPQTGWAVPGFFWEAELHSPDRDERGVFVPAIPVMVIGRNTNSAWTVTSALDANADTFVEQLDPTNTYYYHDGQRLTVQKTVETIPCNNPPSNASSLLQGVAPQLCPPTPVTMTVYRTIHGPSIADPDSAHHLYVRESVIDGRLLQSLTAWDLAGRQHTAQAFGAALQNMSLGFNFFYVDDQGQIGYWHTGTYPIRARNADPRLPLPGNGAYDWQGFESWAAHPHVIDPKTGYVVNWNNKPAAGWWSKNLETGGEGGLWGDQWESVPLAADVARAHSDPITYQQLGQIPRQIAYIDNPARVFLPYLLSALKDTTDPQLVTIRGYLRAWDGERNLVDSKGTYSTPAIVFFDRFLEMLMRDAEQPVLGSDWFENAGLACATCTLVSVDNLTAPTYKFEYPGEQVLAAALDGHTAYRWIRNRSALFLQAARDAAAELTSTQGSNPAAWNEPAESAVFSAQGAISVPNITPLPNRGSYGQVVEASGTP